MLLTIFLCVGPPQTSPVNLELATGSVTPTSDISADQHQVHTIDILAQDLSPSIQ